MSTFHLQVVQCDTGFSLDTWSREQRQFAERRRQRFSQLLRPGGDPIFRALVQQGGGGAAGGLAEPLLAEADSSVAEQSSEVR